eukprot:3931678-Rhodomonas_salina.1
MVCQLHAKYPVTADPEPPQPAPRTLQLREIQYSCHFSEGESPANGTRGPTDTAELPSLATVGLGMRTHDATTPVCRPPQAAAGLFNGSTVGSLGLTDSE